MSEKSQFETDCKALEIDHTKPVKINDVTTKYKAMAKLLHPDKAGGSTEKFQELLNIYRRLIKYIESNQEEREEEDCSKENAQKKFFMKHNFTKRCSKSYVVHIENSLAEKWKDVLHKHLRFHKIDDSKIIFKSGLLTITIYIKPKKDNISKIHIQSGNQDANLDFIMESMSLFYREVCQNTNLTHSIEAKSIQRSICGKCGRSFETKKGFKLHSRVHAEKHKTKTSIIAKQDVVFPITPSPETRVITLSINKTPVPVLKKTRIDESILLNSDENNELERSMIKEIVNEITNIPNDESRSTVDEDENRFQCGECATIFPTYNEVEAHVKNEHRNSNTCRGCDVYKLNESELLEKIEVLKSLEEKNSNLVSKNVSLDRENRLLKLALTESETEKQNWKRQFEEQSEIINADEHTKSNDAQADEDVNLTKLKTSYESLLKEKKKSDELNQKSLSEALKAKSIAEEELRISMCKQKELNDEKNTLLKIFDCMKQIFDDPSEKLNLPNNKLGAIRKFSCAECTFVGSNIEELDKHKKDKHLRNLVVNYPCETCDTNFMSLSDLNIHKKEKHRTILACTECNFNCSTYEELSIHNENHAKKISFPCIKCDLNFDSSDHLREHRITTHDKDIRKNPPRRRTVNTRKINKTCYFWNTGFCKYADLDCKFLHESSTDECRYGEGCNNYQCPFFHVVTSKRKKRGMLYKHYQN